MVNKYKKENFEIKIIFSDVEKINIKYLSKGNPEELERIFT
jgi:hypothetical protein